MKNLLIFVVAVGISILFAGCHHSSKSQDSFIDDLDAFHSAQLKIRIQGVSELFDEEALQEGIMPVVAIEMDGKPIGNMASGVLAIHKISKGEHEFKMTADGYKTQEKTIYIIGKPQKQNITFSLEKITK